jgi:hypothetical protein
MNICIYKVERVDVVGAGVQAGHHLHCGPEEASHQTLLLKHEGTNG